MKMTKITFKVKVNGKVRKLSNFYDFDIYSNDQAITHGYNHFLNMKNVEWVELYKIG